MLHSTVPRGRWSSSLEPMTECPMLPDRILVVDDDLSMRQMLSSSWNAPGTRWIRRPREALLKIDEKWPDLVMTDLNMPGSTGLRPRRSSVSVLSVSEMSKSLSSPHMARPEPRWMP